MDWFYRFKLHLIVNDRGELLSFCLTPDNVRDRDPVPMMVKDLWGKLIGDRGYLGQELFEKMMDIRFSAVKFFGYGSARSVSLCVP